MIWCEVICFFNSLRAYVCLSLERNSKANPVWCRLWWLPQTARGASTSCRAASRACATRACATRGRATWRSARFPSSPPLSRAAMSMMRCVVHGARTSWRCSCHARSTAVLATVHAESVHVWRLCLWLIPGLRTCPCLCPQASAVICDLRAWANEPCRRGATRSASCTTSRARARRRCAGRRSASTTSCAPRLTCSRRRRAPSLSGGTMGTCYSLPRSDVALLGLL